MLGYTKGRLAISLNLTEPSNIHLCMQAAFKRESQGRPGTRV